MKAAERRRAALDMIGKRFGRLRVISRAPDNHRGWPVWRCRCDCGHTAVVLGNKLRTSNTRSCGCLLVDTSRARMTKHGYTRTSTYRAWLAMRNRCNNKRNRKYYMYGARGIRVCKRWDDFRAFLRDMGERPPGLTIERIDNNGDYRPGNCRWATPKEQANNTRRNVWITINGETLTQSDWAKRFRRSIWWVTRHYRHLETR